MAYERQRNVSLYSQQNGASSFAVNGDSAVTDDRAPGSSNSSRNNQLIAELDEGKMQLPRIRLILKCPLK